MRRLFLLLPAAALIALPQIAAASPNHKGAKAAHSHSQIAKHPHKAPMKMKAAHAKTQ